MNATVLLAIFGILGTLLAAIGPRLLDSQHERRTWLRDQRLEAHAAFLNSIARLLNAAELATNPIGEAKELRFRDRLGDVMGAFNRLELVCTGKTYDLAVGVMAAAGRTC
jgi:hypothetical protein